jgi:hypothetical protein
MYLFHVSRPDPIYARSGKRKISHARAVISFLSVNYLGLSLVEVDKRLYFIGQE